MVEWMVTMNMDLQSGEGGILITYSYIIIHCESHREPVFYRNQAEIQFARIHLQVVLIRVSVLSFCMPIYSKPCKPSRNK